MRAKDELAGVLERASVGRARGDAIASMSRAYRRNGPWNIPGATPRSNARRCRETSMTRIASADVVRVALDVVAGYDLRDDDAIDATRALRARHCNR